MECRRLRTAENFQSDSTRAMTGEDEEYFNANAKLDDGQFLVIVRASEAEIREKYALELEYYVATGYFEVTTNKPELPSSVLHTVVQGGGSGAKGLLFGVSKVQDLWRVLQIKECRRLLQECTTVNIECKHAKSGAKIGAVLALCDACRKVTVDIYDADEDQIVLGKPFVVLRNVDNLCISYDRKSGDNLVECIVNDTLKEANPFILSLIRLPVTPAGLQKLFSPDLKILLVSLRLQSEFAMVVRALQQKRVVLDSFQMHGMNIGPEFRSSAFSSLTRLFVGSVSVESLLNLLDLCGEKLKKLYLHKLDVSTYPDFVQELTARVPHLTTLGVYGCEWLSTDWIDELAEEWQNEHREPLDTFVFDKYGQMSAESFADPYSLTEKQSKLARTMMVVDEVEFPDPDENFITEVEPMSDIESIFEIGS